MRNAMLVACVLVAIAGCDEITSKLKGDKEATATTAAATTTQGLPPECETFLARYSCFLRKQGKPTTEADQMRASWIGPAAQPASRPGIQSACTTQLSVQAQNFKNAGCESAAPGAAPVAVVDAGKATPTATAAAPVEDRWVKGTGPCPNHTSPDGKSHKQFRINGYCRVECPNPTCCDHGPGPSDDLVTEPTPQGDITFCQPPKPK